MILLVRKHWLPSSYIAIAIFPFVVFADAKYITPSNINHERIHLRQQLELLILGFYIWYLVEFLFRLIKTRQWSRAYREISFEQEAYRHEHDLEYLKSRKFFAFVRK